MCALVCALPGPAAQERKPAPTPAAAVDKPAIKVTTRLVEVNVVVLDKKGLPVLGLTREDFEVFDEGAPQVIREFSMQGVLGQTPAASPPAQLPPNTFSNQKLPTDAETLSVILFDELNTKIQDKLFARQKILRFLSQLRPQDRIAIYLLSDRLRVLHDFSSDSAALIRIIERQTGTAAHRLDAADIDPSTIGNEPIDAFLDEASRRIYNYALRARVRSTVMAIEWIARY